MTREQKMEKRKLAGKSYAYSPNPYIKGTKEYDREVRERAAKNVSRKTPTARWTSLMAKLDNQLEKEKMEKTKANKKMEK